MKNCDRLILPRADLSAYLFAAILRDTRGRELAHLDRFNHFPASPLCAVNWVFDGDIHAVEDGRPTVHPLPRLSFTGPQTSPITSWNPGDVRALSLGIYPEAWQALTGHDIGALKDQILPLNSLIEGHLLDLFEGLETVEDFTTLQTNLFPIWRNAQPNRPPLTRSLTAWSRSLAVLATTSGLGRSLRQAQRRLRTWTGQDARSLELYARIEELGKYAAADGGDLALLAQSSGFSDQSHMGRNLRKVTGSSPARLLRHISQDEAFWPYRLLGSGP